jgi:hypothetical protein
MSMDKSASKKIVAVRNLIIYVSDNYGQSNPLSHC